MTMKRIEQLEKSTDLNEPLTTSSHPSAPAQSEPTINAETSLQVGAKEQEKSNSQIAQQRPHTDIIKPKSEVRTTSSKPEPNRNLSMSNTNKYTLYIIGIALCFIAYNIQQCFVTDQFSALSCAFKESQNHLLGIFLSSVGGILIGLASKQFLETLSLPPVLYITGIVVGCAFAIGSPFPTSLIFSFICGVSASYFISKRFPPSP